MKQENRSGGLPLPPAITRRTGHSSRESHDASLVPPFKGKLTFQPAIVKTKHAFAEQPAAEPQAPAASAETSVEELPATATTDALAETAAEELPAIAITDALVEAAELADREAPAEFAAALTEPVDELDVQDLFPASAAPDFTLLDAPPVAQEPEASKLTLSPEFEEATILVPPVEGAGAIPDVITRDDAILELGAFIEPPASPEPEAAAQEEPAADVSAALAALAAEYDALEFDAAEDLLAAAAPIEPQPQVQREPEPAPAPAEIPDSTLLEAAQAGGLAHHELADRLQQISQRLRVEAPEQLLPSLARGDRFEVLIAGLLAGFLAARND